MRISIEVYRVLRDEIQFVGRERMCWASTVDGVEVFKSDCGPSIKELFLSLVKHFGSKLNDFGNKNDVRVSTIGSPESVGPGHTANKQYVTHLPLTAEETIELTGLSRGYHPTGLGDDIDYITLQNKIDPRHQLLIS